MTRWGGHFRWGSNAGWVGCGILLFPLLAAAEPYRAAEAELARVARTAMPLGRIVLESNPWVGVRLERWRRDVPGADWLIVWIDLRTPGLGYRISPWHLRSGPAGTPRPAAFAHTALDLLERSADPPRVDLAVNTVAYWPFPAYGGSPVFLNEPVWSGDQTAWDPEPGSWMLGLCPGRAVIDEAPVVRRAGPLVALGSFHEAHDVPGGIAVRDGELAVDHGPARGRTLAGSSQDGHVLILLVVDGYDPGASEGLSLGDAARVIRAAGAHRAIFFDGGGSSTMAARDHDGHGVLLNRPAGQQNTPGTLRHVAMHLGLTNLRPAHDPVPGLDGWQAPLATVMTQNLMTWARVHPDHAALAGGGLAALVFGVVTWIGFRRRRRIAPGPWPQRLGWLAPLRFVVRMAVGAGVGLLVLGLVGQVLRDRSLLITWIFYLPLAPLGVAGLAADLVLGGRAIRRPRFAVTGLSLLAIGVSRWCMMGAAAMHTPESGSPAAMSLMHWNVQWGGGGGRSDETWAAMTALVRSREPDILVLSEAPERDLGWLDGLADELGASYVLIEHPPESRYWYRLAVLSRWPLRLDHHERIDGGRAMLVEVAAPSGPLRVLVVDAQNNVLSSPRQMMLADIGEICRRARAQGEPVDVIAGDLNTSGRSVAWQPLLAGPHGYRLAARSAGGWCGTWPAWCPIYDIDHVLVAGDCTLAGCEVFTAPFSDHRAQIVRFEPAGTR